MTLQEKILYHQIHPFKLFTDISAEFVSLYLFWRHKLIAGIVLLGWLRGILWPKKPYVSGSRRDLVESEENLSTTSVDN